MTTSTQPAYVTALQGAYGEPSQNGFGSAVFFEQVKEAGDLEKAALRWYEHFVGDLWDRYGKEAWMGAWRQVYARPKTGDTGIVAALRSLEDPQASSSGVMILDAVENADAAQKALAAAFDDPTVAQLTVFTVGDGAAMSGLLIAGRRSNAEATFLIFLLD
ncbi:MAG: hypothetical protein R2873_21890 [Caldilineaceae bacterium]